MQQSQKADFEANYYPKFIDLVAQHTGIKLSESKVDMVYRRFTPRLKKLGLDNFGDYYAILQKGEEAEIREFSNLITTNLTSFFREKHHFEFLKNEAFPAIKQRNGKGRRLRIWSAGCSTGEEPYSIAMTLKESIADIDAWDAKILATDLDTTCLDRGITGIYKEKDLEGVSESRRKAWFSSENSGESVMAHVKQELKSLIAFKHLNLMRQFPFSGKFDVIFCRNVMIYFDKPTQTELIAKYAQIQEPGDLLIIGHSENICSITANYALIGNTIYRRI